MLKSAAACSVALQSTMSLRAQAPKPLQKQHIHARPPLPVQRRHRARAASASTDGGSGRPARSAHRKPSSRASAVNWTSPGRALRHHGNAFRLVQNTLHRRDRDPFHFQKGWVPGALGAHTDPRSTNINQGIDRTHDHIAQAPCFSPRHDSETGLGKLQIMIIIVPQGPWVKGRLNQAKGRRHAETLKY